MVQSHVMNTYPTAIIIFQVRVMALETSHFCLMQYKTYPDILVKFLKILSNKKTAALQNL